MHMKKSITTIEPDEKKFNSSLVNFKRWLVAVASVKLQNILL